MAVMVGLLMVPLVGFAAISVDVAAMWAERQQLQTGADAGALAVAADCAVGDCGSAGQTAQGLAGANADGAGANAQVSLQGSHALTVTTSGVRQHLFAPVLGIRSSTIVAHSSAGWGAPDAGTARLPLVLSWCDFSAATGGGLPSGQARQTITWAAGSTSDAAASPDPASSDPASSDPTAAGLTGTDTGGTDVAGTDATGTAPSCAGPSGGTVSSTSGWLAGSFAGCKAATSIGSSGTLGTAAVPDGCSSSALGALQGQTVLVPVSDDTAAGHYRVYGYAAFTITGYHFDDEHDWGSPCSGADRCVQGYFTRHVDLSDAFTYSDGAPQLGAAVVALTQ